LERLKRVALRRPRHRWEDNIKIDLGNRVGGCGFGFLSLRIGTGGGLLLTRNEPSDSLEGEKFLDQLSVLIASQEGQYSMKIVSYYSYSIIVINFCA
jgi:hypothetical protein